MARKELEKTFIIVNQLGLHARAASKLVSLAKSFSSEITVSRAEASVAAQNGVDAKSIMKVMMLAAPMSSQISVNVAGEDAERAMSEITLLLESGFGEGDDLNREPNPDSPA